MNQNIVSALMTKLTLLFGAEGGFLAFHLPGLPIAQSDLNFCLKQNESGLSPQAALNAAANFATLVNQIPNLSHLWSSDGRLLWQEYQTILNDAIIASDSPGTSENTQLENAKRLLYQSQEVTDSLGTRTTLVDTPYLTAYKQYQAAYLQAQRQYNTMKISAQFSADPTIQQTWSVNEPEYAAKCKAAQEDWVSKGYQHEVEQAFAIIDQITGRNFQLAWEQWKDEFQQSKLSDLQNGDFYQTFFYPAHFFKAGSENQWTQVVLLASEIEKLSTMPIVVPEGLSTASRAVGDTSPMNLAISQLSVDLIKLPIMRPWFNPGIFKNKSWKWPDGRDVLSDGAATPHGRLPAYITALVFARNLEIQLEPNSQFIDMMNAGKLKALGPLALNQATVTHELNSIKAEGMQIIAFICEKLPRTPDPDPTLAWTGPISLSWLGGQFRLDRATKINQIKVTIHTGNADGAGTDANVYFRVHAGDWLLLDKPLYNDFEKNDTDTYGPFTTESLTVETLSKATIELKHDNTGANSGWHVAWLRLEVLVEGQGWIAYKEWQPGWLATDEGDHTIYRKLQ